MQDLVMKMGDRCGESFAGRVAKLLTGRSLRPGDCTHFCYSPALYLGIFSNLFTRMREFLDRGLRILKHEN
jgi:hypothetical protein